MQCFTHLYSLCLLQHHQTRVPDSQLSTSQTYFFSSYASILPHLFKPRSLFSFPFPAFNSSSQHAIMFYAILKCSSSASYHVYCNPWTVTSPSPKPTAVLTHSDGYQVWTIGPPGAVLGRAQNWCSSFRVLSLGFHLFCAPVLLWASVCGHLTDWWLLW